MPLPLLFTLPPSNRHDFITLNANTSTLPALNQRITATLAASPNCIECKCLVLFCRRKRKERGR